MYGDKGPPKGYSVPRHIGGSMKKHCQGCSATDHWTYECPQKEKRAAQCGSVPKLSRTLMLKYGIKQKRVEFVPTPTEREAYDKELQEAAVVLLDEVREEAEKRRRPESDDKQSVPVEPADNAAEMKVSADCKTRIR